MPERAEGDNDDGVGSPSFPSWAGRDKSVDEAVPVEAAARRIAARRAGGS